MVKRRLAQPGEKPRRGGDTLPALVLGQSDNAVRQRLRAFYQEAPAKAGARRAIKRTGFDVHDCFAPLLRWLLSLWSCRRLAVALAVTHLGQRCHILSDAWDDGGGAVGLVGEAVDGAVQVGEAGDLVLGVQLDGPGRLIAEDQALAAAGADDQAGGASAGCSRPPPRSGSGRK
jgi:hypothetical protein